MGPQGGASKQSGRFPFPTYGERPPALLKNAQLTTGYCRQLCSILEHSESKPSGTCIPVPRFLELDTAHVERDVLIHVKHE